MNVDERLEALREAIDGVDTELLGLLNRRMELAVEVGRLKRARGLPLFCPGREEEIFERLGKANEGPLPEDSLRSIYREILAASRFIQELQQTVFERKGDKAHGPMPALTGASRSCSPDAADNGLLLSQAAEEPT